MKNEIFNREPDTPFTRKDIEDIERMGHNLGLLSHPQIPSWAVQGVIRVLVERVRFLEGYFPCKMGDNHFAAKGSTLCKFHGGSLRVVHFAGPGFWPSCGSTLPHHGLVTAHKHDVTCKRCRQTKSFISTRE